MIKSLLKLLILLAILAIPLSLFHGFILDKVAKYLYCKDELKPADIIVVIPDSETRYSVDYGVKLFKEGWAKKERIILSGGNIMWKYAWASLMQEQAVSLGVPRNAILLEEKSTSTKENAIYTREIMKRHRYTSLILVTAAYHSKRAGKTFRKIMGNEVSVLSAPAEESKFRFEDWWKRERDRKTVLIEYFKFFWFWLLER